MKFKLDEQGERCLAISFEENRLPHSAYIGEARHFFGTEPRKPKTSRSLKNSELNCNR